MESLGKKQASKLSPELPNSSLQTRMSNWVSAAEHRALVLAVDSLRSELAALRLSYSELQRKVDLLEENNFEVVSHVATPAQKDSVEEKPLLASPSDLAADRVAAAEKIGAWIRRCLDGRPRGASGREGIDLPSNFYLVIRDYGGVVHNPPRVFTSWSSAKSSVASGKQYGGSVFVGVPTAIEGRIALKAAGLDIPDLLSKQ